MASFLRRTLIESDLSAVASVSSPYVAGALFGAASWALGDACAMAATGGHPPVVVLLPPVFALFSLVVLALVPRSYLASLDDGGGGGAVFDTGGRGEGLSASARAKVLLFLAWACSFGAAAGGVALAASAAGSSGGSGGGGGGGGKTPSPPPPDPAADAARRQRAQTLAAGSLSSTILTLVAGMVLWFGRGSDDDYGRGYYGY